MQHCIPAPQVTGHPITFGFQNALSPLTVWNMTSKFVYFVSIFKIGSMLTGAFYLWRFQEFGNKRCDFIVYHGSVCVIRVSWLLIPRRDPIKQCQIKRWSLRLEKSEGLVQSKLGFLKPNCGSSFLNRSQVRFQMCSQIEEWWTRRHFPAKKKFCACKEGSCMVP